MQTTVPLPDSPVLRRWFGLVDAGDAEGVMTLLADDFAMSMQLARGDGTAVELTGGAARLADHLSRRGRSDIGHVMLSAATVGQVEHALGKTLTLDGELVSTFSATAGLDRSGRVRRLLVCRTAFLAFDGE